MVARVGRSLDSRPPWLLPVAREVLAAYHRPPADRPRELAAFVALALEGRQRPEDAARPPRVRRWLIPEPAMGSRRWPVPELASFGALTEFLALSAGELEWLADARGLERTVSDQRLRNYLYSAVPRRGGPPRLIERPKFRLKSLQRRILHEILDWIPAHDAAHGFTRGRSAVTNASEHTRRLVVLRLDLEDFFASIAARRVFGIFRTAGYPESVAYTLTALSTNVVPIAVSRQLSSAIDPRLIASQFRLARRLATRICRKALRPRRPSRTSRRSNSTAASPGWQPRSGQPTRATPTTSRCRAHGACCATSTSCAPRSTKSHGTKGLR